MSAAKDSNGRPTGSDSAQGVLANLPRTRPQRATARRAAARRESPAPPPAEGNGGTPGATARRGRAKRASAKAPASAKRASAAGTTSAKPAKPTTNAKTAPNAKGAPPTTGAKRTKTATTSARTAKAPAGRRPPAGAKARGEERVPRQGFESEMDRATGPVQPPGGAELVSSAAEIIGELARAGLSSGERLLRDAIARLPLS